MSDDHAGQKQPYSSSEGEPTKPMLIAVMSTTMLGLYLTYVIYHLMPQLQSGHGSIAPWVAHESLNHNALVQFIVFHILTVMLLICYARAMLADPGAIPHNDDYWDISERSKTPTFLKEWRGNGNRRSCKWCEKYKPDRSYHCRVCRKCVLKMDHHCRWINNCVGFGNYKFFFLLLLYTVLDLNYIVWTMAGSVQGAITGRSRFFGMIPLLISEFVALFLGALVTLFFVFHVFLVINGMSYIEFCEKKWPRLDAKDVNIEAPNYNLGAFQNLIAVFGTNPLFWLLPVSTPSGNGLAFPIEKDAAFGSAGRSKSETLTSYGTWGRGVTPFFRVRKPQWQTVNFVDFPSV